MSATYIVLVVKNQCLYTRIGGGDSVMTFAIPGLGISEIFKNLRQRHFWKCKWLSKKVLFSDKSILVLKQHSGRREYSLNVVKCV